MTTVVPFRRNTFGSEDDLLHLAYYLQKSGLNKDRASELLHSIAGQCVPPLSVAHVIAGLDTAFCEEDAERRILSQEILSWVLSSDGSFLSSDVDRELHLSSRVAKKNRSKILHRLREDGLLESVGNRRGCFRRIEKESSVLDWESVDNTESLPIVLILSIEEYIRVFKKNILIVAGTVNSGKTALCLNIVKNNLDKYKGKINYYSSEMGPEELRKRLDAFNGGVEWSGCNFYERASSFADCIVPDAINIIDYLEVTDNFYMIGGEIKAIFDKLRDGIAVIAIQKKKGQEYARGGDFSAEKARLYLSLESGLLKIVKAKNWARPGVNPNGMEWRFKLLNGCEFIKDTPEWGEF